MLTGGCLCGHVRYEARGTPFDVTVCHCADCRRVAGAPMVGWFTVRPTELVFASGRPRLFASSPGVQRGFCPTCGTPLTFRRTTLDEVDVTLCSLDMPDAVPPEDHVRVASKVAWIELGDMLPHHLGKRPPAV